MLDSFISRTPYKLGRCAFVLPLLMAGAAACGESSIAPGCGDGDCAEDESVQSCAADCDFDIVVVVEAGLREAFERDLEAYIEGLAVEGFRGYVVSFELPGTASELRALLSEQFVRHNVEGAFLVGNLPAAWYEQRAFGTWEEFPMDLYLQDLDDVFLDTDENGVFDTHSELGLEIYTSRVMGDVSTLQHYFERVNRFRKEGPLVDPAAFIFIDDDWSRFASDYGLQDLYQTVDMVYDPVDSTIDRYLQYLTSNGAEFVLQMMHSGVTYLLFEGEGAGILRANQIRSYDLRLSFVHLWNCWSARFVQDSNLAMIYTVEGDYGLAAVGSTKKGAVRKKEILHGRLVRSDPLGEAFRYWYNVYGRTDDEWALGVVLIGDPMLTVWGDAAGMLIRQPPGDSDPQVLELMEHIMRETDVPPELSTFEDYKLEHPEFFSD